MEPPRRGKADQRRVAVPSRSPAAGAGTHLLLRSASLLLAGMTIAARRELAHHVGAVYRATDAKLNREVAIKVLTDSLPPSSRVKAPAVSYSEPVRNSTMDLNLRRLLGRRVKRSVSLPGDAITVHGGTYRERVTPPPLWSSTRTISVSNERRALLPPDLSRTRVRGT